MIWFVFLALVLPFGLVLLFGAPYLPTRKAQAEQALDLLNLKKGEVFVDLGCGDGALLVEAARRGLVCYGYELNPFVWLVAYVRTIKYRANTTVALKNYWAINLPKNTKGVYVFLLDSYMTKLDKKLATELQPGCKLVSYTFNIPNKKPIITKGAMRLYQY